MVEKVNWEPPWYTTPEITKDVTATQQQQWQGLCCSHHKEVAYQTHGWPLLTLPPHSPQSNFCFAAHYSCHCCCHPLASHLCWLSCCAAISCLSAPSPLVCPAGWLLNCILLHRLRLLLWHHLLSTWRMALRCWWGSGGASMVGRDDRGGRCDVGLLVCWWYCHQNSTLALSTTCKPTTFLWQCVCFLYGDSMWLMLYSVINNVCIHFMSTFKRAFFGLNPQSRGWLYGMGMDLYKSWL